MPIVQKNEIEKNNGDDKTLPIVALSSAVSTVASGVFFARIAEYPQRGISFKPFFKQIGLPAIATGAAIGAVTYACAKAAIDHKTMFLITSAVGGGSSGLVPALNIIQSDNNRRKARRR